MAPQECGLGFFILDVTNGRKLWKTILLYANTVGARFLLKATKNIFPQSVSDCFVDAETVNKECLSSGFGSTLSQNAPKDIRLVYSPAPTGVGMSTG
jgi:hypothetical protein